MSTKGADKDAGDAGYDEWLDAVAAGEGYYLACPEGHGSLPPRRTCPRCGSPELSEAALEETGHLETYTRVHVAGPRFVDDTPYVTGVAAFGPVRLTGVIREGEDAADEAALAVGERVAVDVGTTETTGDRVVVLRPG